MLVPKTRRRTFRTSRHVTRPAAPSVVDTFSDSFISSLSKRLRLFC